MSLDAGEMQCIEDLERDMRKVTICYCEECESILEFCCGCETLSYCPECDFCETCEGVDEYR